MERHFLVPHPILDLPFAVLLGEGVMEWHCNLRVFKLGTDIFRLFAAQRLLALFTLELPHMVAWNWPRAALIGC